MNQYENLAFYKIHNFAPDQTQEYYFRNFPVLLKTKRITERSEEVTFYYFKHYSDVIRISILFHLF